MSETTGPRCSFCGASEAEAPSLFVGLAAWICTGCVGELRQRRRAPAVLGDGMSDYEALQMLPTIREVGRLQRVRFEEYIAELRRRRISWARIGHELGISRQAAWERFGRAS